MELVQVKPQMPLVPSDHEMMVYSTMAEQAVTSKMYRGIGEKSGVMMVMLAARELGIAPMQALNGGLNIISGKVEISARMMNAMIRRAGHSITIEESDDTKCILTGKRADNGDTATSVFTINDAKLAGLIKPGGGWTKFPKDMCFARALSRLARQLFSDVIGIGYVEGEISGVTEMPTKSKAVAKTEEEIVEYEEVVVEDKTTELLEKYLNIFEEDDKPFALEYLKAVEKHFAWTREKALTELMMDVKKLSDKFHIWKQKIIKAGE